MSRRGTRVTAATTNAHMNTATTTAMAAFGLSLGQIHIEGQCEGSCQNKERFHC
jgi:hypothetical protein